MTVSDLSEICPGTVFLCGEDMGDTEVGAVVLFQDHRDILELEPWDFLIIDRHLLKMSGLSAAQCLQMALDREAAGIGLELDGEALPPDIHREARRRKIPVLSFPERPDYQSLVLAVLRDKREKQEKLTGFRRELRALTCSGYRPVEVLRLLSGYLDCAVDLMLNNSFQALTHHNSLGILGVDDIVRRNVGRIYSSEPYAVIRKLDLDVYVFKIPGHMEVLAFLTVIRPAGEKLEDIYLRIILEAIPAVSNGLLSARQLSTEMVSSRDEFFTALLQGLYGDRRMRILGDAYCFGVDNSPRRYTWIIQQEGEVIYSQEEIMETLTGIICQYSPDYFGLMQSNRMVFITTLPPPGEDAKITFLKICRLLMERLPGIRPRIGVGRICLGLSDIPDTYHEARFALTIGRMMDPGSVVHYYGSFVVYHMLCQCWGHPVFARMYAETIQVLARWDADNGSRLLPTLNSLAECDFSVSAAAEHMALNRNTIYKRINRISDLLHLDLEDPEVRIMLRLVIKIQKIAELYPETEDSLNWVL